MSVRAQLIDIEKRSIEASKKDNDIYHNGIDNDYPERSEGIINNSVTAKLCAKKMKQYIFGRGLEFFNDYEINTQGKTLFDLVDDLSDDVPYHKSIAIHVNYDVDGIVNTFNSIRSKKIRISKEDIFNNKGLIWVSDYWAGNNRRSKKQSQGRKFFYPFNPDLSVINQQREQDLEIYLTENKIKKDSLSLEEIINLKLQLYRGQVLYVNMDNNDVYPNNYVDPAYNDADTEYRISNFRNKQIRDGFVGTTIFTVLDEGDESQQQITDDTIKKLMGSNNAYKSLKVAASVNANGDLSEVIRADTIKTEIDTERFRYDEEKVQENILNCFNNIPKILVRSSDASLFGSSGDALEAAQEMYNQETLFERMTVEKVINKILRYTAKPFSIKIVDILGSNLNDELVTDNQNTI